MLYYLDKSNRRALRPLRGTSLAALGWSEKDLENLVAEHIGRFVTESQLFVIAQEARGQAAPDIMALDAKGNLHIFELKRWEGNPEALLQVLRYGQTFGQYDYSELNAIFLRHRRRVGVPEALGDLQDEHCRHFELQNPLARQDFNRDQHFVVMTNGLDRATRQAIAYWGRKKIDVRPLLYRVYETAGRDLLLEIDPYGPEVDACEDDASDGLVVVNTNSTYMPDAWRDMLRMSKASAFYERKSSLDGIVKGTPIALYHTGDGERITGARAGQGEATDHPGRPVDWWISPSAPTSRPRGAPPCLRQGDPSPGCPQPRHAARTGCSIGQRCAEHPEQMEEGNTMRDQENKRRNADTEHSAQRGPSQGHASSKTFTLRTDLRAGAYERENNTQE